MAESAAERQGGGALYVPHATDFRAVPFELLELKETRDAWSFTGYASTFGNVDLGGDVVLPGAFSESLKQRPRPRLLWQHQQDEPIGVVESLKEDERGLLGTWKLSRTTRGADAHTLLKDGAIDSLSIGFIPGDSEFTEDGIRKLKAIDLIEVSLVSVPMNEEAMVTAVKMARMPLGAHLDRVLDEVRLITERCRAVKSLRADDGRPAGATVGRMGLDMPSQLKALAAEIEMLLEHQKPPDARHSASSDVVRGDLAEVDPSTLSVTQLRLRIAHKRMERRGIALEHAHT